MKRPLIWEKASRKEQKEILDFAEDYRKYLDEAKTEREAVEFIIREAEKKGFVEFGKVKKPAHGAKFYIANRNKNVALVV